MFGGNIYPLKLRYVKNGYECHEESKEVQCPFCAYLAILQIIKLQESLILADQIKDCKLGC